MELNVNVIGRMDSFFKYLNYLKEVSEKDNIKYILLEDQDRINILLNEMENNLDIISVILNRTIENQINIRGINRENRINKILE